MTISRVRCVAHILCVAFTMLLAACGGGGSGSDSGGPSLSISTTSVTFTAAQNGPTPATQTVGISIAGGQVFIDHTQNGSTFTHAFRITGQTTGAIDVIPFAPTMAPGTYTGTITVSGCSNQSGPTCNHVAGSPRTINVTYTVQPQTGLAASPQSLSFAQLQGGPAPASQALGISDVGAGSYAWNASIVYQSGSGWLNVNGAATASGATLPTSLSISVNSSATLGTLNALIRVTGTGNGNTLDVPVSFTVSEPQLNRSPASLTFNALRLGPSPATQDVTLTTQGSIPVAFTAVVNYGAGASGWLNAPVSGSAPGTFAVGVNTTTLAPGTYTANFVISTATQTLSVAVTYVVSEPTLTRSPTQLTFNAVSTGTLPVTQDVTLSTQQSVSLNFSTSISYGAGASGWLSAPANGTAPNTVTVGVNTTNLVPGTYTATLTFTTTTQTVTVGITYVVATSSLTFSPTSPTFTIDTTSLASALTQNVSVSSTGVPLTWTAASNSPLVTVSPASGSSGTMVTLSLNSSELQTLDSGTLSATITLSYQPPNQGPTSASLTVSLNLLLPKVNYVSPYVQLPSTITEVILRGTGFVPGLNLMFGATPVSPYTVVSDTEIRVSHPSLGAGSYPVTFPNQLGLDRSRARLLIAEPPIVAAVALPTSLISDRTIYDAERASVYTDNWIVNSTPGVSRVERHRWNGSAWVTDSIPFDFPIDFAMTPDGAELIVLTPSNLSHINLNTWTISKQVGFSSGHIAMGNDGNALILRNGSLPRLYDVRAGSFVGEIVPPTIPPESFGGVSPVSSLDGSRILVGTSSTTTPPRLYYFDTGLSQFVQAAPSCCSGRMSYDRTGSISIIDPVVRDRQFNTLGVVQNLRQSVISPNGTRGYGIDPDQPTILHTYDLTSPDGVGGFIELAPITLPASPGIVISLGIANDGKTVFISGENNFVVQPVP